LCKGGWTGAATDVTIPIQQRHPATVFRATFHALPATDHPRRMINLMSNLSSEQRVLGYFLVCFFAAALALIGHTWWQKTQACKAQCMANGSPGGSISLSGGGRLNMSTVCGCKSVRPTK
jgi:hypothetical protein